jgi:uncharacterized protein (UPF0210 family)
MTIITKGMGAIIKRLKTVGKKARKKRLEFLKGQRNIYKKDSTGKKDKIIKHMNETMKRKKHSASPGMIDHYHKVMTSDFEKRTGPYFKDPKHGGSFKNPKPKGKK